MDRKSPLQKSLFFRLEITLKPLFFGRFAESRCICRSTAQVIFCADENVWVNDWHNYLIRFDELGIILRSAHVMKYWGNPNVEQQVTGLQKSPKHSFTPKKRISTQSSWFGFTRVHRGSSCHPWRRGLVPPRHLRTLRSLPCATNVIFFQKIPMCFDIIVLASSFCETEYF